MRADLPTGTVTFLFTDIEGSTRLLHELGPEAYAEALAKHRRALRKAFSAHGGVEVDTQGDAFFVAFPTASSAAAAALQANEALRPGPVRIRAGVHTGTPTRTAEGYVGVDVHRAARIGALAHGGQVVVSAATASLLDAQPLGDLGLHRLKDFGAATRLHQLGAGDFPPLRTPGSVDLPTPATPFLGRERELFEAVSVVLEHDPRLLTVVGPGGTGKTRFAIELARLLAEEADGGTVFVPLAPLRDPALAVAAVADAIGAPAPDQGAIATRLGDRRTHVVLDNAEHLLPGVARPLAELLAVAPALRLLATSREAVRIAGEFQFDLPPLSDPEAVALFVERARAVRPDVGPSAAVSELCERLDRLPLALELAAARTKVLAPDALLDRLGDRLDLLKGTRDADERHSTLRATMAWSYELLDEREQTLFARLSVFRGGCTLDVAEDVCDADVDTLESLLDKSLVRRRTGRRGEERYWMLETIREFARERLAESGEQDDVRRRHAERVLEIAQSAHMTSEEFWQGMDSERVHAELDDVRAALDWAASSDPVLACEIFVSVEQLWVTGLLDEGRGRLEVLLEVARDLPPPLRARLHRCHGSIVILHGERERGEEAYRHAIELFHELGDEYNEVALRARFAVHAGSRGDADEARRLVAEVRERNARIGNPVVEPQMLSALGDLAYHERDLTSAHELYSRSVEAARASGFMLWEMWQSLAVVEMELALDKLEEAESTGQHALLLARGLQDHDCTIFSLTMLAHAALRRGDAERAGILWGAMSEAERERPLVRSWDEELVPLAPLADSTDPRFLAGVAEGRLLSLEQAAVVALGDAEVAQTVP